LPRFQLLRPLPRRHGRLQLLRGLLARLTRLLASRFNESLVIYIRAIDLVNRL
jgi:hypothetical protein